MKIIHIDTVDGDIGTYYPEDPNNFCTAFEITVGKEGNRGEERFTFHMCTPLWFKENLLTEPRFLRHVLFVSEYDTQKMTAALEQLVAAASETSDFKQSCRYLNKYLAWEFEDFDEQSSQWPKPRYPLNYLP